METSVIIFNGEYYYNKELSAYYRKIEPDENQPEWLQSAFVTFELNNKNNQGICREYYKSGKVRVEIPFIIVDGCFYADGLESYEGFDDVSPTFSL